MNREEERKIFEKLGEMIRKEFIKKFKDKKEYNFVFIISSDTGSFHIFHGNQNAIIGDMEVVKQNFILRQIGTFVAAAENKEKFKGNYIG